MQQASCQHLLTHAKGKNCDELGNLRMAAAEILIFTYFFVTFYEEKGTFLSPLDQN